MDSDNIDQVDSFNYLANIISKDSGCSENINGRVAKDKGAFLQLK